MSKRAFVRRAIQKVFGNQMRRLRRRMSADRRRIKYLEDVFSVYVELRKEEGPHLGSAQIAKMIGVRCRRGTRIIRLIIDVTAGNIDHKQKEQWTQGLRYAYKYRKVIQTDELQDECEPRKTIKARQLEDECPPDEVSGTESLWSFLDKNGGIEGCARKMSKT